MWHIVQALKSTFLLMSVGITNQPCSSKSCGRMELQNGRISSQVAPGIPLAAKALLGMKISSTDMLVLSSVRWAQKVGQ